MRLTGRVALVTGGTGGIGTAIARRLLTEDARAVVVTGRDPRRGAVTVAELGDRACFLPQDVTDETRWAAVLDEVVDRFGGLDILVNNAGSTGGPGRQDPESTTMSTWRAVLAVNLDGVFLGCRAALPVIGERGGGSIVNISSTAGLMSTPKFVAYGAAKAAVTQLTKSVAVHCARAGNGVRCNSVHPSLIDTELGGDILRLFDEDPERARAGYVARVPLGEIGVPDDVAAAVAFLVSDDARYITGEQLVVSGGLNV